jgi:S-adenosyl methyltransferase
VTGEGIPAADELSGDARPGRDDRPAFDTSVAHIARVYDYWLGGKDNYAADRQAGDLVIQAYPDIVFSVRANRAFLARVVRYLARAGIRQFLDIGTGIPAANNTHEVAQSEAPSSRVVYVDNDPIVLAHARALLTGSPGGVATDYIDADVRDTGTILTGARQTLDFSQPVAVMLIAILHMIGGTDDPYQIVARLVDAVPPGSYLALSHVASDILPPQATGVVERLNPLMDAPMTPRSQPDVMRFFDGLEMIEPGLVRVQQWRPDSEVEAKCPSNMWGGVARKN